MNRAQRRAGRVRAPDGAWLYPQLLYVVDRDERDRPRTVRVTYDDERVGDVVPEGRRDKADMLLVWMAEAQGFSS